PGGDRGGFQRRDDRPPRFGDRDRGGDRPTGDRGFQRRDDRPGFGDRSRGFDRGGERPSGDRPGGDRPTGDRGFQRRDDRPGFGQRDDRRSFGDRDRGGDRPGGDRGFQRRDDRGGFGQRDDRRGFERRDDDRPRFADRDRERPWERRSSAPADGARTESSSTPATEELELPDDIDTTDLDADIRAELRTLVRMKAQLVGGHLVMAGRLVDEDPEKAYAHARAAQQLAPRLAATREALGLAAYLSDRYAEALSELRAARRITGSNHQWAVMADCERGLGRPEKALEMSQAPEAKELDKATQVELRIVAAGARRDMGQPDAAVVLLQGADLTPAQSEPWTARLRYAYAEALLESDREDEAREWFGRASEVDPEGLTGAGERLAELDGLTFEEVEEELDDDEDTELDDEADDDDEQDDDVDEDDGEFEDEDDEDEDDEDGDEDGDDEQASDDRVVKASGEGKDEHKERGPVLENDEEQ
ncbi:MAG: tetratricopeptide repeat protein, partial [Actinocrinis sp.]